MKQKTRTCFPVRQQLERWNFARLPDQREFQPQSQIKKNDQKVIRNIKEEKEGK